MRELLRVLRGWATMSPPKDPPFKDQHLTGADVFWISAVYLSWTLPQLDLEGFDSNYLHQIFDSPLAQAVLSWLVCVGGVSNQGEQFSGTWPHSFCLGGDIC